MSELRMLIGKNMISQDTLICEEGTKKWRRADELLFLPTNRATLSTRTGSSRKESHSFLATILIFLATLSFGGGIIMGLASLISGLPIAGIGYFIGGGIGGIMWYTLYVLLNKNK